MARRLDAVLHEIYDGRGFVVLRGLPVERYSDEDVGLIFWGMGRYLGAPLYQNPKGDLLGHVFHDTTRKYGDPAGRGYVSNAYDGFYSIRREEVHAGTGVSERPIPVFGVKDGVVSCRYLRRRRRLGLLAARGCGRRTARRLDQGPLGKRDPSRYSERRPRDRLG
jgi:hypothetical protein